MAFRLTALGAYGAIAAASGLCLGQEAARAQPPAFLDDRFATDPAACVPGGGPSEALMIEGGVLSGYELACLFLAYHPVRWAQVGPVSQVVIVASCGDDTGITRPDLLSVILEPDGALTVQSQNEYVEINAAPDRGWQGHVSRRYERCE